MIITQYGAVTTHACPEREIAVSRGCRLLAQRLSRSRPARPRPGRARAAAPNAAMPASSESADVAEDIGTAALDLAKRARAAGLTAVGYLLECVALEAGTEAIARRWPSDHADD